jgi:hypothetical protein
MYSPALNAIAEKVTPDHLASTEHIRAAKASIPSTAQKKSHGASLVGMVTVAALAFGFMIKKQELIEPGEGLGYKLGLAGGLMMLALLFYPAFKRTRFFGSGTRAVFWFRWHMLLGIFGPLLVFYHSNFSMGAMNSNVALISMILVAGSGVIGRYFYNQVHSSMSNARLDVGSLLTESSRLLMGIEEDVGGSGSLVSKAMADFSVKATPKNQALAHSLFNTMTMPGHRRRARGRILKEVRKAVAANSLQRGWTAAEAKAYDKRARNHVDEFLVAVSRAAQFTLWGRLFGLWHVMHVPLFFLLLVSGVIHVIAVHLY